jgi:hypothetical protein
MVETSITADMEGPQFLRAAGKAALARPATTR